jgi:VCBS repeat protein
MMKIIISAGFCVLVALLLLLTGCGSAGKTPLATLAFAPRIDLPTNGNGSDYLAIADFNGDGKLDIAISGGNASSVAVFLNNGNGTFSAPVVTTFAPQTFDVGGIVVGDFNEDGIRDLVVGPILLLGNGDGTFHQGPALPGSLISNYSQTTTADLNGDGHLDLIAAGTYLPLGGNGYVAVSLGNGDGTFRPVNLLPVTSVPGTYDSVVVADFNGDKKLDILACDYGWIYANGGFGGYPSTLLFYAGNGDGTFQAPVLTTTWNSAGIAANADFTGTGRQDLLITSIGTGFGIPSSDGKDGLVLGNGDGTFQGPQSVVWIPNVESGDGLRSADLDLDGKADVLTANRTSGVLTLILNGAIGQVPPAPGVYQFTIAPGLSDIATGDLNGDGLPDVVVSNPTTQQISIFLSQKQ